MRDFADFQDSYNALSSLFQRPGGKIQPAVVTNDYICFLTDGQDNLAGAIRSTTNRHPEFSANMMMLGRNIWKPIDILSGVAVANQEETPYADYVRALHARTNPGRT